MVGLPQAGGGVKITTGIYSIPRIEKQALAAFNAGEPIEANPYTKGSTAHRVWLIAYQSCAKKEAA
jgi:hypothetical protein